MIANFTQNWVWPAGGSGGIWGDVVGTLIWVVIAGIVTYLLYPPVREALKRYEQRHLAAIKAHVTAENAALHKKLNHIIVHHPDIPPLPEDD